MTKYYFIPEEEEETCFPIEEVYDHMRRNMLTELEVYEATVERGTGYFYCKVIQETGETGNCGKMCDNYKPRNGVSGICSHHRPVYDYGKEVIITVNGKVNAV